MLSDAAFGFRAGRGTLHAAQVVADVIHMQRSRRAATWLASFDVAKCFDSLPWWAVFRLLKAAGVADNVVDTFAAFYRDGGEAVITTDGGRELRLTLKERPE